MSNVTAEVTANFMCQLFKGVTLMTTHKENVSWSSGSLKDHEQDGWFAVQFFMHTLSAGSIIRSICVNVVHLWL